MSQQDFDVALVGGGLQAALITLALRARRPATRIAIVERSPLLGGNHTWSFHDGDLSAGARDWVAPLVSHRWPGYRVLFPRLERHIPRPYASIESPRLHEVVSEAIMSHPGSRRFLDTVATRVGPREVALDDGTRIGAALVIDARGPAAGPFAARAGYQKFLGLEVRTASAHGVDIPIIMDATVAQSDGYRFVYVLPLAADRLLVEDTYFHHSPELDHERIRDNIHDYLAERGIDVSDVVREESGRLPMPWAGTMKVGAEGPLIAGYQGGWFHPATGYSLPVAARLADYIASHEPGDVMRHIGPLARDQAMQMRYCYLLNGLLFKWYPPDKRRSIFERFYRLPLDVIERFYSLRLSGADRWRLLVGRPPRGLSPRYRLQWRTQP